MRRFPKRHLLASGGVALWCAALTVASGSSASPAAQHPSARVAGPVQNRGWFGYDQGTLEQQSLGNGAVQFSSITANWRVPVVSQHDAGETEFSSTWAGIGGGCVDAGCSVKDQTLIQAGTEQDWLGTGTFLASDPTPGSLVNGALQTTCPGGVPVATSGPNGSACYYAWYELVPPNDPTNAQQIVISSPSSDQVSPGDVMHVDIVENPSGSGSWTITVADKTKGWSDAIAATFASSHDTAEWIEEKTQAFDGSCPLLVDCSLPDLSGLDFWGLTVNGHAPDLQASEAIQLVDPVFGLVEGTPSAPTTFAGDQSPDAFSLCSWAASCNLSSFLLPPPPPPPPPPIPPPSGGGAASSPAPSSGGSATSLSEEASPGSPDTGQVSASALFNPRVSSGLGSAETSLSPRAAKGEPPPGPGAGPSTASNGRGTSSSGEPGRHESSAAKGRTSASSTVDWLLPMVIGLLVLMGATLAWYLRRTSRTAAATASESAESGTQKP